MLGVMSSTPLLTRRSATSARRSCRLPGRHCHMGSSGRRSGRAIARARGEPGPRPVLPRGRPGVARGDDSAAAMQVATLRLCTPSSAHSPLTGERATRAVLGQRGRARARVSTRPPRGTQVRRRSPPGSCTAPDRSEQLVGQRPRLRERARHPSCDSGVPSSACHRTCRVSRCVGQLGDALPRSPRGSFGRGDRGLARRTWVSADDEDQHLPQFGKRVGVLGSRRCERVPTVAENSRSILRTPPITPHLLPPPRPPPSSPPLPPPPPRTPPPQPPPHIHPRPPFNTTPPPSPPLPPTRPPLPPPPPQPPPHPTPPPPPPPRPPALRPRAAALRPAGPFHHHASPAQSVPGDVAHRSPLELGQRASSTAAAGRESSASSRAPGSRRSAPPRRPLRAPTRAESL